MKLYFAPMEGITNHFYRTLHRQHFSGADRYYSPFLSPTSSPRLSTKELRDVLPENNVGLPLVPQILTNDSRGFLQTAEKLRHLGYAEVNLNLGCPSGTVTAKGRGAGFLARPLELEHFLEEIFTASPLPISIKTRIGMDDPEEFPELLELFNRFPVRELIIHPRVRQEFYKGKPHRESFAYAAAHSKIPLCYNGDVFTPADFRALRRDFPQLPAVMLGRGLIANPALARELAGGAPLQKEELYDFLEALLECYRENFSGDKNAICHLKELWFYIAPTFTHYEKHAKAIQKSQRLLDYRRAVEGMFEEELKEDVF